MRNWELLPFCDPNDILDLSASKSINNTTKDSLPEKVEQNLIKYINLKIPFNGEKIKNILKKLKKIFENYNKISKILIIIFFDMIN